MNSERLETAHESNVKDLMREYGEMSRRIYDSARHELEKESTIYDYIPVLAIKKARKILERKALEK